MIFQSKAKFLNKLNKLPNFIILGIDIGFKKTGLSIYNNFTKTAVPLIIINNIINELVNLIYLLKTHHVTAIIIGYPLNPDSVQTIKNQNIENFIKIFIKAIRIPLILSDERFTTSLSNKFLKMNNTKSAINNIDDIISASILLENFFY